jgi:FkbM family methyltransferase
MVDPDEPRTHPIIPRISYAQNGEDILVDRLFGDHVGRYIDVGSYHPFVFNNTHFFYERGWRGVNIEPTRQGHALFREHRPEDLNLALAVSDRDGEMTLYEVLGDRGNSTLQLEIAEPYRACGVEVTPHQVPVLTLRSLIDAHGLEPPDLLSIDVEGHETAVIRGTPLDSWRPRVLVVEATVPLTTIPSHHEWEPILLDHGYLFGAFNGVNRFYVREDLRDLLDRLATPVNILDRFVPQEVVAQRAHAEDLEQRLASEHERVFFEQQKHQELIWAWERDRSAWDQERCAWDQERCAWDQERCAWDRERAEMLARLTAYESERAGWERRCSELERGSECLRGHLEATQRQLRPYRLIDGLGVVTAGYSWARKIKHRLVS